MVKLTFINYDAFQGIEDFIKDKAVPHVKEIECSYASVPTIMAWYGGYHAGDNYQVMIDGVKIPKDINGEPLDWEDVSSEPTKSLIVRAFAEERGLPFIDIPLTKE